MSFLNNSINQSDQTKFNFDNQFKKDFSTSSNSSSDNFSDTVDNLSSTDDSKLNQANDYSSNNENTVSYHRNLVANNETIIISDNYMNDETNCFYDCNDRNLNNNSDIHARGEMGIFSSSLTNNQSTNQSRSIYQSSSLNNFRNEEDSFCQNSDDHRDNRNLIDIHEHLSLTVLRLQQTIKCLSNKLDNLESKVNDQQIENLKIKDNQIKNLKSKLVEKQNWWSKRNVLLILWPFAAHLIISAIKKKVNKY